MLFVKLIKSATKNTTRTKKLVNKPSGKLPKSAPKRNLSKNTSKWVRPSKKSLKTKNKPVSRRFKIKPNTGYPLQDVSLPVFQDLLEQGYDTATFVAHPHACSYCKKRNGMKWKLKDFISNLQYDAPIFEKAAHVNAQSNIKVSDSKGELEDVYVNYNGEISYTS